MSWSDEMEISVKLAGARVTVSRGKKKGDIFEPASCFVASRGEGEGCELPRNRYSLTRDDLHRILHLMDIVDAGNEPLSSVSSSS